MRCITLLTDFGLKDAAASVARSIVLQHNPGTEVLDLSHCASGKILTQAAYLLQAYRHFPAGSCHLLFVGVYYSRRPALILCAHEGHYFLAPDNGVLQLALGAALIQGWKCMELTENDSFADWQQRCAALAAQLREQTPDAIGLEPYSFDDRVLRKWPAPVIMGDVADCQVLHIDHHGNVVINMTQQYFEELRQGRGFRIDLNNAGRITAVSRHYGEVADSEVLCRFNSLGYMEIALNGGSASELLGFKTFDENKRFYTTVKIFFA
jgi:S-adenosylmethionine hydrolase